MADVFANLPVTDLDVYNASPGDFAALTARVAPLASGADGVVGAGSFVLTSAFPFFTQGVQAGHVLVTHERAAPAGTPGNLRTVASTDALAVTAAADYALTLGRPAYAPGQGAWPNGVTPAAGVTGVRFSVPSVLAQIKAEYAEVRRMLGVVTDADLVSPTDLKKITVLKVLRELYFAEYRMAGGDAWKSKYEALDAEIRAEMAGLTVTYGDETPQSHRPVAGFAPDPLAWRVPADGLGRDGYPYYGRRWY